MNVYRVENPKTEIESFTLNDYRKKIYLFFRNQYYIVFGFVDFFYVYLIIIQCMVMV